MEHCKSDVKLSEDKSYATLTVKIPYLADALALQKIVDAFCDHMAEIHTVDEVFA